MAAFTVRVELHGATSGDYEVLHAAMQAVGFARTITSNEGVTYLLPTAEYVCSGEFTRAHVLTVAGQAASKTGKNYSILVSETVAWNYIGLWKK